jgi:transcriptional regulator with XRE-family HTH domain
VSLQGTFGEVLKEERQKQGLSQEALAFKSGLDRTFVSLIERGKRQPSIDSLFKLSKALSVKASQLIERLEEKLK